VQQLWYVAYGSNLSLERFRCYVLGGQPAGGSRRYPGCRDPREPQAVVTLTISGGIYFAGRSSVWGGGMALYDSQATGRVAARGYLLSAEQFVDVLAQEMRQAPGVELDLSPVHGSGEHTFGPGRYETLVRVGTRDGLPMVTFTCSREAARDLAAPTADYLATMISGLREAHGWTAARIADYLAAVPGAAGVWTAEQIAALAAANAAPAATLR